jgi:hypothetical protein
MYAGYITLELQTRKTVVKLLVRNVMFGALIVVVLMYVVSHWQ